MDQSRPNLIFIITDQQRFDTINALGFPHVDTPHLDRLVNEGVTFTNCHVTAPSCAPSRASLFTGQYPHTNGILKNADRWTKSWISDLADSGYHCVNAGKMHTFPFTTPCGFHERYVVENKDRYLEGRYFFDEWDKALAARGLTKQQRVTYREREDYADRLGAFTWDLPEETQSDNFVGDLTKWWLKTHPKEDPLFLQIGFPGPHPPYDPTPAALAEYADREIPLQPLTDEDLENQPAAYQAMRKHNNEVDHDSVVLPLAPTEQQRLDQRRHYLANVTMIDTKIGEIIESLDEQGYLENSVIIFTSDHGDCLTDHGHSQKWTFYEQVTRMPTIVWSSNGRFGKGGRKIDELTSLFDLGPTILELAGCEVPANFTARSLMPALLEDETWKGRDFVFAEGCRDGNFVSADYQTMIRSRKWKLVHIAGSDELDGKSEGQLFDLINDPDEQTNLWNSPDHLETKNALLLELFEWRVKTGHHSSTHYAEAR
ncbi:sulfatase-like hydrolase/transferase [Verrucomicrobiales bacterium BCK34]|nr:sulfatase-like hydrolase/transferase [Verrucomicrobiales bacterium BCK34]